MHSWVFECVLGRLLNNDLFLTVELSSRKRSVTTKMMFVSGRSQVFSLIVANSYTVHSTAPERRVKYRAVRALCSRDVVFRATHQRGAASCQEEIAAIRGTARRRDPIHFLLVVQRVGTQSTWSTPVTSSEDSRSPPRVWPPFLC